MRNDAPTMMTRNGTPNNRGCRLMIRCVCPELNGFDGKVGMDEGRVSVCGQRSVDGLTTRRGTTTSSGFV